MERTANKFDLLPPVEPIKPPFRTSEMLAILGIARNTLFDYESRGIISEVKRSTSMGIRNYSEEDLLKILKHMQSKRNPRGKPGYPFLDGIDLDNPESDTIITMPSGYTLRFGSMDK